MGRRLWEQSECDIQVARKLLSPGSYYVAANLAHQAAEKALKAAHWHVRGEEPPWQHDLVKCVDLLAEVTGELPRSVKAGVAQLQPVFLETRYPSGNVDEPIPAHMIGEEDARQCIVSAEEVMAWTYELLQQRTGRSRRKTRS